jgi:hypothetical protein
MQLKGPSVFLVGASHTLQHEAEDEHSMQNANAYPAYQHIMRLSYLVAEFKSDNRFGNNLILLPNAFSMSDFRKNILDPLNF